MNIAKKGKIFLAFAIFAACLLFANINVKAEDNSNQVTIYYGSYDKSYIHYQIGNGTWTQVPGEKMENSSEYAGYPYKKTINLGNAQSVTACFNDGKGSWDNNNYHDYKLTAGTYKIRNGYIEAVKDEVKIQSFYCYNNNYSFPGGNAEFRMFAKSSQNKTVYYTLTATKDGKTETILGPNTAEGRCLWWIKEGGNYLLTLTARDDLGNTDTKTMDYKVPGDGKLEIQDFYCYSPQYNFVGGCIEFRMAAYSQGRDVSYTVTAEKDGKKETLVSNSGEGKALFVPKEAGTYLLTLKVTDKEGNEAVKTMNFTVPKSTGIDIQDFYCYSPQYNFVGGCIEFRMAAYSEGSNVYYTVTAEKNGKVQTLTKNTSEGKALFVPEEGGDYLLTLTVTNDYGNKEVKKMNFKVPGDGKLVLHDFWCYNDTYNFVNGCIEFRMGATSAGRDVYYTVTAEKDGKVQVLTSDTCEGRALFIPKEPGDYKIKLVVTDKCGNEIEKTIDFTVPGNEQNQITVYYKGYENPNMHYKIGNGSWTQVPGIKMEATKEMPGYTHKLTIDLNDSKDLTACFNDGNNNWDSRNGANYYFGQAGVYTYSNGVITKIK